MTNQIQNSNINIKGQQKLLRIARQTLEAYLKDGSTPDFAVNDQQLNQACGVFVTLWQDGRLRGCIGEFVSREPLYKLVQKKAIDAAIHDPRFYPLCADDLRSVRIEISVLSPCRKINDWQKIKLGRDGVLLKNGAHAATFLPQVATETGWGLTEFLNHLCLKAGLSDDAYLDRNTLFYTYSAQVFQENV